MALTATSIAELRFTGSDTLCSGWFDPAIANVGTDYTVQDSAQVTFSGTLSAVGTTTLVDSGNGFLAAHIGNTIRITGQALYQILTVPTAGTCTVDRTLGTFSLATGYLGGGIISIGQFGADNAAVGTLGNGGFIKYNVSNYLHTNSSNVAGGKLSFTVGGANVQQAFLTGYNTTRTRGNTDALRPTLKTNAASVTLIGGSSSHVVIENLIMDGNTGTNASTSAVNISGTNNQVSNCTIQNFAGIAVQNSYSIINSVFSGNTSTGINNTGNPVNIELCEFYSSTSSVISITASICSISDCLFYNNTGASTDAVTFSTSGIGAKVQNCTFYKSGRHGVTIAATSAQSPLVNVVDCIFDQNGGYGVACSAAVQDGVFVRGSAFYLNTSGDIQSNVSVANISNKITLSGSPINNAAGNDYSLNNTAGAGASCRGVAVLFPRGTTTTYRDKGAVQSQAAAGTSGGGASYSGPMAARR